MRWTYALLFFSVLFAESRMPLLWKDPGDVAAINFAGGAGGHENAPAAPFVFYDQEKGGTSPKLLLKDANKRTYVVKWGEEVKAEAFATRMMHAAGYFAEPAYYVASGRIESVGKLDSRAEQNINRANGNSFSSARFELRDDKAHMLPTANWSFDSNPFRGTPQLNGLKIMMMLLSNWDIKDARSSDGPNTALVEYGGNELRYMITDLGGSMGKWGNISVRSKWNCEGYASQTGDFVKEVKNGVVEFGYSGKRADDIRRGITVNDIGWLMQYLGKVTDAQLRDGLVASGASPEETTCFAREVRQRLNQLSRAAGAVTSQAAAR